VHTPSERLAREGNQERDGETLSEQSVLKRVK
jgi:hypothetical protein